MSSFQNLVYYKPWLGFKSKSSAYLNSPMLEQKKIGIEYSSKEDVIVILKIKYSTHHNVLNRYDKGQVIY